MESDDDGIEPEVLQRGKAGREIGQGTLVVAALSMLDSKEDSREANIE